MSHVKLTALFATVVALIAASPVRVAAEDDRFPEKWRTDENAHMVAIEALVVEVNEDRSRDLGVHVGFTRTGTPSQLGLNTSPVTGGIYDPVSGLLGGPYTNVSEIVQGADIVFGRTLDFVDVPTFTPTFPSKGIGDPTSGLPLIGFDTTRLPGLGFTLQGLDVNGGTFAAQVRAFLDQGEARIVTRPVALALNNTKTFIHVGSEVPYQDIAVEGTRDKPIVAFEKVGVDLDIVPSILDLNTRTVQLDITQVKVSSVSQYIVTTVKDADPVQRPVFNRAETRTKITLREGETYMISSLKARRSRSIREGIPLLMNIPYLGHLFSSRSEIFQGVDIFFFITIYIVPPGQNVLIPYDFTNGKDLINEGVILNDAQMEIFDEQP